MKKQQVSRSGLFLMELILTIFFFALSSAVCVQLFAKAHLISRDTNDLNVAVAEAQSAAALLKSSDGSLTGAAAHYPDAQLEDNTLTVYYDDGWLPCSPKEASRAMRITTRGFDHGVQAHILLYRVEGEEKIYALDPYFHRHN